MRHASGLFAIALLAGCGSGNDQPGGVTAGEAQALNDAAEMLDARTYVPEAVNGQAVMQNSSAAKTQTAVP